MNIQGKKVLLRAIRRDDLQLLQKWANDPALQSMLGGWHFPISEEDQSKWFGSLSFNSLNQRFAIDVKDVGIVGTANLVDIDWTNRNAFHGVLIGDEALRGQGYALDAVMALMRFAFEEANLYRLDTDIIEYNLASLKFYVEKCGWKREGVRQNWFYRKNRRWNKILIGITKDDYEEHCATTGYWKD